MPATYTPGSLGSRLATAGARWQRKPALNTNAERTTFGLSRAQIEAYVAAEGLVFRRGVTNSKEWITTPGGFGLSTYSNLILSTLPVAYWPLDDASRPIRELVAGRGAVTTDDMAVVAGPGPGQSALRFDGVDDDAEAMGVPTLPAPLLLDEFTRTMSPNWSNPIGSPWTVVVGTTSVDGSKGLMTGLAPGNVAVRAALPHTDLVVHALCSLTNLPLTGAQPFWVRLRHDLPGTTAYLFGAFITSAGVMQAGIRRTRPSDGTVSLASFITVPGFGTYVSGDLFHMEASIVGTTLELRVWRDNTARPAAPTVTAVDVDPILSGTHIMVQCDQNATTYGTAGIASWDDVLIEESSKFFPGFTVMAWMRTTDASATTRQLAARTGTPNNSWALRLNSTHGLGFVAYPPGTGIVAAAGAPAGAMNDGLWHMAFATFDGKVASCYRDGSAAGIDNTIQGIWNRSPVGGVDIGHANLVERFPGDLAHVTIWNRVLTDTERNTLFTGVSVP